MNRFKLSELPIDRIYDAVSRRIINMSHSLLWKINSGRVADNKDRLKRFENLHQGQRCFIIGNGPSISNMNLTPLEKEITFGLNRIYLAFDKLSFVPTYYVCVNELVLKQFAFEIEKLSMPKFLNWNYRAYFDKNATSIHFINLSLALKDKFNTNISSPFFSGGTVTYVAIQLAYIMGFSEIILIGVDHSFKDKGVPNKVKIRTSDVDANHFHPDYFPKGFKWQLPDLLRSELAYTIARDELEQRGRRIVDATENGKLTVFKKVAFKDLVNGNA
jgi:hypothetical protein